MAQSRKKRKKITAARAPIETDAQRQKKLTDLKARFEVARSDRTQYDNYIDTAYRYSIPQRRVYLEAQNKLAPNPEIYDDTAVIGVQKFASKMQTMLVPSQQNWMKLSAGSDIPKDERDGMQEKYDNQSDIFFEELAHSNFDTQVAESFQDLAISTGALIINPAPIGSKSSVHFQAVPVSEFFPEKAPGDSLKNMFREHKMHISKIKKFYPEAVLNAQHNTALEKDPVAEITILESCIYDVKTDLYTITVLDPEIDHQFLERIEDVSPWVVFRENVVAGAALGFGRIMRVLPTIKSLNKVVELTLKGGSMAVSGTFTAADDGVLNPYNVRLRPGGVIPVLSNDVRSPSIARLDTPTSYDWSAMLTEDMRSRINEILLANPYGQVDTTPVRSATETVARGKDFFDSVASSFGRMQVEFVSPVIRRVAYILAKAGVMEPFNINGRETSFKFISPLSRLQQTADVENVIEWMSMVASMGEELMQTTVKMEAIPGWLGEKYGVPQELMRTKEEMAGVVKAANDLQNEAAAAAGGGVMVTDPMAIDPSAVATPGMGMEGI